jgi:hypothetical protein
MSRPVYRRSNKRLAREGTLTSSLASIISTSRSNPHSQVWSHPLLLSVLTPALPAAAAFSSDFLDFSSPSAAPPVSYASTSIAPKNDPFGFDDITSASSVHRSQSGSSLPMGASPSNSNGSSSPMGMARVGGPMGGGPAGRGPMAMGAMGGRGNGPMGFDAFNVMNPTQQTPSTYRGQPGRR